MLLLPSSQSQFTEMMYWREDRKLSWLEFEGEVQAESPFEAMTVSGIEYGYQVNNRNGEIKITFQVRAYFNPNTSWVKPSSRMAELLAHEQVHFDISELHARSLSKALNEAVFTANFKGEIEAIYQSVINRRAKMQELYDRETNHSRNPEKQLEWIKRVTSELKLVD